MANYTLKEKSREMIVYASTKSELDAIQADPVYIKHGIVISTGAHFLKFPDTETWVDYTPVEEGSAAASAAAAASAEAAAESARTLTIDPTLTQPGQAAEAKATGDAVAELNTAVNNEAEALGSIQFLAKGSASTGGIAFESTGDSFKATGTSYSNVIFLISETIKAISYSTIEEQTKPISLKAGHTYIIDIKATPTAYSSDNNVRFALADKNVTSINNVYFWAPCRTGRYILNAYSDVSVCAIFFVQWSTAVTDLEVYAHIIDTLDAEIEKHGEALENLRNLYYTATIPVTVQQSNTTIPFAIHVGETLKFTNNTTGNIALNAIDADGVTTSITTGITPGSSISFTASTEYVQLLYWSQQLGTVAVEKTSSLYNVLSDGIVSDGIASVGMFESIGAIGDSYTAGSTKNSGGTWVDYRNLSWIATMGKRSGTEWKNYGHGGATTKTYLETTEFTSALSDTACGLYFFALGQNDGNQGLTIGTVADIHDSDYTQNADTFYGNYGRIIQQIKDHAPNAKLVMVKNWVQGATWTDYDTAIETIAAHYSIPCINPFDDYFFNSALYQNYKEYGHPTALGHSSMGIAMERLFSKCVVTNPSYFKFATIG